MIATTPRALAGTAALATAQGECWRCQWCNCYIGRIIAGVLHEPNGSQSGLPWVRRCPECRRRNVRVA